MRMTIVERTHPRLHRSNIIIHRDLFHEAEFDTVAQLDFFAKTLGFTYEPIDWHDTEECGIWRDYRTSHEIESSHFTSLDQLPDGAKPIKALSNGSIVTCYYLNDGKTIRIYRPNPNCPNIYSPLPIEDHISHVRAYGLY